MANKLDRITQIVIVMMENRSFDHMLGYLAFPEYGHPLANEIDGVPNAMERYQEEQVCFPKALENPILSPDPPHERCYIQTQIAGGQMNGFVTSYRDYLIASNQLDSARIDGVMEYCTSYYVPTTDFLAKNFTICDRWFAPLPASTLPNRLFASSGYAMRDVTPDGWVNDLASFFRGKPQPLVFDWLAARNPKILWRVYHNDLSFYGQWLSSVGQIISPPDNYLDFDQLPDDARTDKLQGVTYIEPLYEDNTRRGTSIACDDHPPASLWSGQTFLKKVYQDIAASPSWKSTLLVITYDEHGSFFDHVPPQPIPAAIPANAIYQVPSGFTTTGLRVPAIVISPFVKAGGVCHTVFDHTSILKLLGDKYNNKSFNADVDARPVASLSEVLDDELLASNAPIAPPPALP